MLSSEYKWTDDQILDLYVCRVRQMMEAIKQRRKSELRVQAQLVEWQTRTLAQFIAATVPVERGKKNPLAAEAAKLRLLVDEADTESQSAKLDINNLDEDEIARIVEGGAQVENQLGSFERLTGGLSTSLGLGGVEDRGSQ